MINLLPLAPPAIVILIGIGLAIWTYRHQRGAEDARVGDRMFVAAALCILGALWMIVAGLITYLGS